MLHSTYIRINPHCVQRYRERIAVGTHLPNNRLLPIIERHVRECYVVSKKTLRALSIACPSHSHCCATGSEFIYLKSNVDNALFVTKCRGVDGMPVYVSGAEFIVITCWRYNPWNR